MFKITRLITFLVFNIIVSQSFAESINKSVVGIKTVNYYDSTRQRPLLMDIFYPVSEKEKGQEPEGVMVVGKQARNAALFQKDGDKKLPLIMLCHGYGGSRKHLSWIAESLAKAGYVVAAIEIYGNTDHYDTPEVALKRWVRPLDVTAALDNMLADPEWKAVVDENRIGFVGFSLGGLAGVWLAGGIADQFQTPNVKTSHIYDLSVGAEQKDIDSIDYSEAKKSYKDQRIKAFFLLAPAHGKEFSKEGLSNINVPVHIVAAEVDEFTPLKANALYYSLMIANAKLTTLKGNVGHLTFLNKIKKDKKACVNSYFFDVDKKSQIDYVHDVTADLATKFFNDNLK